MTASDNYLILFADLVGSTDVASEVPPSFYAETYIASFHWAARKAEEFIKSDAFKHDAFSATIDPIHIAGDEVLSFTQIDIPLCHSGSDEKCEHIVASAVAFAYVTKLFWLASPYNLRRMLDKQFPRDVAVGIHLGPAALVPVPKDTEPNKQIASLHLNIAKRIEGLSRSGTESRIFASYDVAEVFDAWAKSHEKIPAEKRAPLTYTSFVKRASIEAIKGLPKPIHVSELAWPPTSNDALTYLLKQLILSPGSDDSDTERASRILAKTYLNPDSFFQYDTGVLAVRCQLPLPPATEVRDYIDLWFKAVSGPTRLFFDECWLVLNAFLISCSFLRHESVTRSQRKKYIKVTDNLLARLQALHSNGR